MVRPGLDKHCGEGGAEAAAARVRQVGSSAVERRLTAAAVNRPLALLRHLLRLAHEEWEAIDNIPRIRLERKPQGRLRWLTQEEIARLLEAAARSRNKELRAAVIVALNTGLGSASCWDSPGSAWTSVGVSSVWSSRRAAGAGRCRSTRSPTMRW